MRQSIRPEVFCASSEEAQALTDDDFWEAVFLTEGMDTDEEYDSDHAALDDFLGTEKCTICGGVGACGWDDQGLPLVHPRNHIREMFWMGPPYG